MSPRRTAALGVRVKSGWAMTVLLASEGALFRRVVDDAARGSGVAGAGPPSARRPD